MAKNWKTTREEFDNKFIMPDKGKGFIYGLSDEFANDIKQFLRQTLEEIMIGMRSSEKIRPFESFANKKIGKDYKLWKEGYNTKVSEIDKYIKNFWG